MKTFKYLLGLVSIALSASSFAQMVQDPTTWKYEVKKKGCNEYQLVFHLTLQPKWHIWSLQPGGDGYEIAPSFDFTSNPAVKLKGKVTEKGKPTVTTMTGIDGKVKYYAEKVDYVQDVTINGKTKITGKHTYQVCNDRMCLPPKDKEFVFEVK